MSKKGSITTSTFLEWDTFISLITRLERDQEYKFCLLIAIGVYTGLRISDILKLKKSEMMQSDILVLNEGKTGKQRTIKINKDLRELLNRIIPMVYPGELDCYIFINRFGTKPIDKSYVNVKLKDLLKHYKIKINGNVTSHTFRKTLGRRAVEVNGYSNESLLLLMDLFQHSNMAITKRYLGIRQDEINNVYDSLCL